MHMSRKSAAFFRLLRAFLFVNRCKVCAVVVDSQPYSRRVYRPPALIIGVKRRREYLSPERGQGGHSRWLHRLWTERAQSSGGSRRIKNMQITVERIKQSEG